MLKTYINKQKGTQEIVKRLFDNSKKHDKSSTVGAKNQNPNKSKHVPLPPADLPSFSQTEADHCIRKWFFLFKYERKTSCTY